GVFCRTTVLHPGRGVSVKLSSPLATCSEVRHDCLVRTVGWPEVCCLIIDSTAARCAGGMAFSVAASGPIGAPVMAVVPVVVVSHKPGLTLIGSAAAAMQPADNRTII